MLSLRPLTNAQQAAVYFEHDDYYVDGQQVAPSSWWGEGARRLRLSGPVDRDLFADLLRGRLPDGTVLEGGSGGTHRPGIDLTFSAPKSVSIAALVGGDARILRAHEEAVTAALRHLQATAPRVRNAIGGTTRLERTRNLIVARFNHDTSRATDPQLHTHAVVLNVTRRADGQWRALANEEVFRSKMIGGAIYRSELAQRLGRLGYDVVRIHADGRFEIGGITLEQLAAFSRRRAQILAHLEARGFEGPKAADAAARATRERKRDIDRELLRAEWRNQARHAGVDFDQMRGRVLRTRPGDARTLADEYLARTIERLTERDVVVSEKKLIAGALNLGIGMVGADDVRRAVARRIEHGELVPAVSRRQKDAFIRHFTTDQDLAIERDLLRMVGEGRGTVDPLVHERELGAVVASISANAPRVLTRGQANAIRLALSTADRVIGIQGYAGTGKTTGALLHIRRVAEERGFEVRGFAPTAAAANVLSEEAGIETMTIARFLASRASARSKPELWIVDEASMMANRTAHDFLERAHRVGARVLLVGDRDQLPSIEAGRAFALLQDHGMRVAQVQTIVRQKDPELRRAVAHTIAREHDRAMEAIASRVVEIRDRSARLAAVAADYVALPSADRDRTLIAAPSNADRQAINDLIRAELAKQGVLGAEHAASILVVRDLTRAERKDAINYVVGDVIRVGRRYRSLEAEAGAYLTVTRVDASADMIVVHDASGRERALRPDRASSVEVYEARRRTLAAGDRIRFTRNDGTLGRHNGQLGRVVAIDRERRVADVLAGGNLHHLQLDDHRHWEHAYASTIHAAQGRTADRVLIHIDRMSGHLVGHESWYVALSRARQDLRVFTDDEEMLPRIIRRSMQQEAALDVAQVERHRALEPSVKQVREIAKPTEPKHELQYHRGFELGF